ncbi:MAG: RluA family pseudouridine synthase [Deltaproteobacteria bacterium]|nr:MAG: RluA family pseudouridine synthase [Deltaproteobacteria bacterium]
MTLTGESPSRGRLDAVVAELFPELSRSRAAALIKEGHVTVDGEAVLRPSHKLEAGSAVAVEVPPPAPDRAQPQDLPLTVVHEDADLVVVDKAPGMVVHPGAGHPDGTLVNALLFHVGGLSGIGGVERPGIVHRLDRGTSGLLVAAKHDQSHQALAEQFAEKTAGRRYLAIVWGVPSASHGRIESHLARHPVDRTRFASTERGGKRAVTHWRLLSAGPHASLVECRLETGRTHQIRVHLAELGHALVNDPTYGKPRKCGQALRGWIAAHPDRPLLHAWRLSLTHPTDGERKHFTALPPADFREALEAAQIPLPELR